MRVINGIENKRKRINMERLLTSSMKIMHGDIFAARAKVLRTLAAPRPTNISTKSDPEQYRSGTPAEAAVARASMVLPVPGGPSRSKPVGARAPSIAYF